MYRRIKNPWLGKEGYNCIGCAPHNPIGLHMKFYAAENETVWGEWMPTDNYQSWAGVVHVEFLNSHDEVCSSAEVVYCQFPKEQAASELGFTGCELEKE